MAAREAEGGGTGSARRRRERRLRAYLKYARMSVAMALAECSHHSAPRGQRMARAREEDQEVHSTATVRTTDPPPEPELFNLYEEPGGVRPPLLVEPQGAQARVARHRVVQELDVPVLFDLPLVEYVDWFQQRPEHAVDIPVSQVVGELSEVHVPQVIPQERSSERFSGLLLRVTPQVRFSEQIEEHIVDVPVHQGIPQERISVSVVPVLGVPPEQTSERIVELPVGRGIPQERTSERITEQIVESIPRVRTSERMVPTSQVFVGVPGDRVPQRIMVQSSHFEDIPGSQAVPPDSELDVHVTPEFESPEELSPGAVREPDVADRVGVGCPCRGGGRRRRRRRGAVSVQGGLPAHANVPTVPAWELPVRMGVHVRTSCARTAPTG